ncbi:MAG: hypothetical protein ABSB65_14480 [Candidatus Acidiferrales bacterium]|jgi:hypothetical protein
MNRAPLWTVIVALSALAIAGCGSGGGPLTIAITAPGSLAASTTGNLSATVTHDPKAQGVTWSCAPVGFCGTFTLAQTASGVPTMYTAPPVAPAGGSVTITATSVTKPTTISTATIMITGMATQNFTFYVTGEENNFADDPYYSLAGVVQIANTLSAGGVFAVTGGEQDYNDGDGPDGIISPQPQGDMITGGGLVPNGDGTGTLTLITDNPNLGVSGTETFAVAFANPNHALITQFDGTATSSGSMDLQTSTALPSGSFSFVASGTSSDDSGAFPAAYGGVFTVVSGALSGTLDSNLGGAVTPGTPFTASLSTPDAFGRGSINDSTGIATSINYYVVGPEVFRIVDVDSATADTAVGSAYGQGAVPGFSAGSIGDSVFAVENPFTAYAAVGQFKTTGGTHFNGVGDLNELNNGIQLTAQAVHGTYTLASDGYGSMNFNPTYGDVSVFGIYAVDPTLNILDPNATTDGGGALVAEMDENLVGTGLLVPQTDVTVADFSGYYAFGAQGATDADGTFEFDFVGAANVTEPGGSFVGTGELSDPFGALTGVGPTYTGVAFTDAAAPDGAHPGRYTINPLTLSNDDFTADISLTVTAYQASGDQLFWIEVDPDSYFGGSLEAGAIPAGDAKKTAPKIRIQKH